MAKGVEDANTYRVGHPLAQRLLERGKALFLPPAEVTFSTPAAARTSPS
jgi:hypothetical protein